MAGFGCTLILELLIVKGFSMVVLEPILILCASDGGWSPAIYSLMIDSLRAGA